MEKIQNKSEAHRRRIANQDRYAPRARPAPEARFGKQDQQSLHLRRLTVQALEDLKRPDAVPSAVIYKALLAAVSGKSGESGESGEAK